jgi:hypothetical protein
VTDGNRIEFESNVPLGTRMNVPNSNAYGILTGRYNENRIPVISGNLTLTASMGDTSLLAMCENVDRSTSNPAIIPVIRKYLDYYVCGGGVIRHLLIVLPC